MVFDGGLCVGGGCAPTSHVRDPPGSFWSTPSAVRRQLWTTWANYRCSQMDEGGSGRERPQEIAKVRLLICLGI
jgi:hypothetical protein